MHQCSRHPRQSITFPDSETLVCRSCRANDHHLSYSRINRCMEMGAWSIQDVANVFPLRVSPLNKLNGLKGCFLVKREELY